MSDKPFWLLAAAATALIVVPGVVAAAQSTTSLIPPLGTDKSKVLTLNLRNRLIFRAADEGDAIQAADFIGKKRVVKRSWGFSAGKRNVNYSETEEHKLKPHQLRNLRDHECVLVHCERGFRRVTLPPGSRRGGLLGQGSVLTVTSYPDRTSPVVRGKWILENLLGAPPPSPPPGVPPLKPPSFAA